MTKLEERLGRKIDQRDIGKQFFLENGNGVFIKAINTCLGLVTACYGFSRGMNVVRNLDGSHYHDEGIPLPEPTMEIVRPAIQIGDTVRLLPVSGRPYMGDFEKSNACEAEVISVTDTQIEFQRYAAPPSSRWPVDRVQLVRRKDEAVEVGHEGVATAQNLVPAGYAEEYDERYAKPVDAPKTGRFSSKEPNMANTPKSAEPPFVVGDYVVDPKGYGPFDSPPVCRIVDHDIAVGSVKIKTVRKYKSLGDAYGVTTLSVNRIRRPTIDEWHRDCMNELDVGDVVDLLPILPIKGMQKSTRCVVDKLVTQHWCCLKREVFTVWFKDDEQRLTFNWPAFATRIVAKKASTPPIVAVDDNLFGEAALPIEGEDDKYIQEELGHLDAPEKPYNPDCLKCHGKGYTEELAGNWPCPDCCPEDHKFVGKTKPEPKEPPYHKLNEQGEVVICNGYHMPQAHAAHMLDAHREEEAIQEKIVSDFVVEIEGLMRCGYVTKGQVFLFAEQAELKLKAERKQLRLKKGKELHDPKEPTP